MVSRSAWTVRAAAWTTSSSNGCGAVSNMNCLCDSGRSQGRHWLVAGILQHGAPAPEPGLSHAAADLPGEPVDMWTIGVADRLRFPASRASSEGGEMLAFAHIPTGTTTNNRIDIDEVTGRFVEPIAPVTAIGADIETGRVTP